MSALLFAAPNPRFFSSEIIIAWGKNEFIDSVVLSSLALSTKIIFFSLDKERLKERRQYWNKLSLASYLLEVEGR